MGMVSETIWIERPPDAVYDFAWRPKRAPEWIVGMIRAENVSMGDPGSGLATCFDWTYRMLGMRFQGRNCIVGAEPPHQLREESSGDLNSVWEWRFEPRKGGTHVELSVTYTPPLGALGRLLDGFMLEFFNRRALHGTLHNLKRMLEAAP